jgi:hypothetical protein
MNTALKTIEKIAKYSIKNPLQHNENTNFLIVYAIGDRIVLVLLFVNHLLFFKRFLILCRRLLFLAKFVTK